LIEPSGNEAVANKNIDETIEDFYRIFDTENVWQGEDDCTKNVPIGNLENWLRKALTAQRTALLTELKDSIQTIDFYGWNEQTQSKIKDKVQAHINNLINPR